MKRTFSVWLSLILACILLFSSCGGATGNADSSTEVDSGANLPATVDLLAYTVVRADGAKSTVTDAAVKLKKALAAKYGEKFTGGISDDFVLEHKGETGFVYEACEILVGETNRKQSSDVIASLADDEYAIKVVDDKLVITGKNVYATAQAVDYFIENVLSSAAADSFAVEETLSYTGKYVESRPALAEGTTLRLMSYNVACAGGDTAGVVTILNNYLPDIINLQECNSASHNNIVSTFCAEREEYKYAQKYHTGGSTLCYTPIIYNSSKMTLVESGVEWLRSRYTGTNTKCVAWAIFETSEGKFGVINFHGALITSSYEEYASMSQTEKTETSRAWRADNCKQIVEIRDELVKKYGSIPFTVNGDCNFTVTEAAYTVLTDAGFADAEKTAANKTNAGYKSYFGFGNGLPGTGNSIDHIFGWGGVYFGAWCTVRDDGVTTASDHCPVYVDYNPFGKK